MIDSSSTGEAQEKGFKSNSLRVFVVGLFLFALVIRLIYINFGLSVENLISDEYYGHRFVTAVASADNPFSRMLSYYPGGSVLFESPFLVLSGLYAVLDAKTLTTQVLKEYVLVENSGLFILASRVASAVAGAGLAVITFFIAFFIMGKKREALVVASFVAIDTVVVGYSHWAKPHIIMNFLGLGSVLLAILFDQTKKMKFFWWAGVAAALSIGTHMTGFIYVFFPILAWLRNRSLALPRTVLSVLGMGLAIVFSLYMFNAPGTLQMFRNSFEGLRTAGALAEAAPAVGIERFSFPFTNLWSLEPSLIVLGAVALLLVLTSGSFRVGSFFYVLSGVAITYFGLITIAAMPHFSRWLIPWVVFITIFSAMIILERARESGRFLRAVLYSIIAVVLLWNAVQTGRWLALLKTNTFDEARSWVWAQPAETKVFGTEIDLNLPLSQQTASTLIKKYTDSGNSPREIFNYYASKPQGEESRFDYEFNQYLDAKEILCDSPETISGFDYVLFPYVTSDERDFLLSCVKKKTPKAYVIKSFGPPDEQLPVLREFDNPTSWRSWWQVNVFGKKIAVVAVP